MVMVLCRGSLLVSRCSKEVRILGFRGLAVIVWIALRAFQAAGITVTGTSGTFRSEFALPEEGEDTL
jgi:hypothetical protein